MKKLLFLSLSLVFLPFITAIQSVENVQELKKSTLDELLANPKNVLDHINQTREYFAEKYKDIEKLSEPKLRQITQKTEQENPLFLLGECTAEDWGACLLSREYAPKYRNYFEEKTVAALDKRLQSSETPVHYTSFACGGMFQDLVVIAKTLAQHPNAGLALHLIDLQHEPYITCRDVSGLTREVKSTDNFSPCSVMDKLVARGKEEGGIPENMEGDELEKGKQNLMCGCLYIDTMAKQFISYLQKTFPNAKLSLYLHGSSDSYLSYLQQQQLPYPDVVTAIDTQDEMSLIRNSGVNFADLAEKTLINNPTASIIQLQKERYQQIATFSHISREPKEDATKALIGEGDEQVEVYGQTEAF